MLVLPLILLGGCDREETRADNTMLCNPATLEAFFSKPGSGNISYISRAESADGLCRQTFEGGEQSE